MANAVLAAKAIKDMKTNLQPSGFLFSDDMQFCFQLWERADAIEHFNSNPEAKKDIGKIVHYYMEAWKREHPEDEPQPAKPAATSEPAAAPASSSDPGPAKKRSLSSSLKEKLASAKRIRPAVATGP